MEEGTVTHAVLPLDLPCGLEAGEGEESRLCWYRKRRYRSAAEAARAAGIPVSTYKRYEADMQQMPASIIVKVCRAIGVSADELLDLPTMRRSRLAERYELMSAADRRLVDGIVEQLAERERVRKERRRAAADDLRAEGVARHLERRLYDAISQHDPDQIDALVAGGAEDRRDIFEQYAEEELRGAHERRIPESWAMEQARDQASEGDGEAEILAAARKIYWSEKEEALKKEVEATVKAYQKIHQEEFEADQAN